METGFFSVLLSHILILRRHFFVCLIVCYFKQANKLIPTSVEEIAKDAKDVIGTSQILDIIIKMLDNIDYSAVFDKANCQSLVTVADK